MCYLICITWAIGWHAEFCFRCKSCTCSSICFFRCFYSSSCAAPFIASLAAAFPGTPSTPLAINCWNYDIKSRMASGKFGFTNNLFASRIISSNIDIPLLDNVMVLPFVEVVVSQDECIRHQSFNTFTNMNLHWRLASHFLLHSDILWFNEFGSCTLPSQSCPLSHLIFSIKCILYTESEKDDELRKR